MIRFRDLPIRRKLRTVIVLTSAVALLLACIGFTVYAVVAAGAELERELQSLAQIIGARAVEALVFADSEAARGSLAALGADARVRNAWLVDSEGRLFAEFRRGDVRPVTLDRYLEPGVYRVDRAVVVSTAIYSGKRDAGTIVVAADPVNVGRVVRRYAAIGALVLWASLVLCLGLSALLERLISRPLLNLGETAAKVSSSGDYSIRAQRFGDDELGELAVTFNRMLGQMHERDVALQEITDALEDRVQERTEELEREVALGARTEHRLRQSLAEKEVLLKEIHHRVKNNLQVISSLISLQASHVDNPLARQALTTSQSRLRSIALVHEMFYQSEALSRIELAPYLASATSYLLSAYGVDPEAVHVKVDCDDMQAAIDTAIPLGLIAHELTSNALLHAFPEGAGGQVRIALQPNETVVRFAVADDGVGLPGHVRWDRPESLGLQLVHNLTRQLEGHVELVRQSAGTCVAVSIPKRLFSTETA